MVARLDPQQALLMVIDLQEKLLPAIDERERVVRRCEVLTRAARILEIPIVLTEQYRKGLGPTDPGILEALGGAAEPLEKITFGCLADEGIARAVAATGRRQLILCGIETHVCVMQTALHALETGYRVFIAEDAVGSRGAADRATALARLSQAGAVPATAEMLIMEALGCARGEKFKAILPLLK